MTEPRVYNVLYIEVSEDVYEYAECYACAIGEECLLVNVGHLLHAMELDREDSIIPDSELQKLCELAQTVCDGDIILGISHSEE